MISIIVAVAKNGVIGCANRLIWHLPGDLKRFKALTMGHPIIMGRKTFESIGRALPGRTNIVVTRNAELCRNAAVSTNTTMSSDTSVYYVESLEAAIDFAERAIGGEEVFVIGGAEVYRQAIDLCSKVYYTLVDDSPEGDAFFEPLDAAAWQEVSRDDQQGYSYINYQRVECCK